MHNSQKSKKYTILLEFIVILVYSIQAHFDLGRIMPKIASMHLILLDYVEQETEVHLSCITDLYLVVFVTRIEKGMCFI
jgi:hypothetical protein